VRHYHGEYARDGVHSNTAESWNALLKRSIVGSFHPASREHLSRYCDEVSFRWDRRTIDDTTRAAQAIKGGEGKRLTYRQPRGTQSGEARYRPSKTYSLDFGRALAFGWRFRSVLPTSFFCGWYGVFSPRRSASVARRSTSSSL
jgi:hypothetical protein